MWNPIPDSDDRFSTGIMDFDRLLGGGFRRGSMALFHFDGTTGPVDRELLLTPTLLNFLRQSNGIIAVLPSRESPHEFRSRLTRWVSRRLFDTRVRVVDYIGEDPEAPYVVDLRGTGVPKGSAKSKKTDRAAHMEKMAKAETAARGARSRMFVELIAFEIMDMIVGSETASRMFLHGIKRTRAVGNLCLGILRPGVGCSDAVRGMADVEVTLHRGELGLELRGVRPAFPAHLVVPDPKQGDPHVAFLPAP